MSRQVNSINLSKRSCEVEESLLLMLFPCIHIAEFNFIAGRRKILEIGISSRCGEGVRLDSRLRNATRHHQCWGCLPCENIIEASSSTSSFSSLNDSLQWKT